MRCCQCISAKNRLLDGRRASSSGLKLTKRFDGPLLSGVWGSDRVPACSISLRSSPPDSIPRTPSRQRPLYGSHTWWLFLRFDINFVLAEPKMENRESAYSRLGWPRRPYLGPWGPLPAGAAWRAKEQGWDSASPKPPIVYSTLGVRKCIL